MRVVYFDHARADEPQPGFRDGGARAVEPTLEPAADMRRVAIPPNTYHGLFGLGVVERLNQVPQEVGPLAVGADALFFPTVLDDAIGVFYWAESQLYGREFELKVGSVAAPDPVEYRLLLDRRAFTRHLLRLVDLFREASRTGRAVQVWL